MRNKFVNSIEMFYFQKRLSLGSKIRKNVFFYCVFVLIEIKFFELCLLFCLFVVVNFLRKFVIIFYFLVVYNCNVQYIFNIIVKILL